MQRRRPLYAWSPERLEAHVDEVRWRVWRSDFGYGVEGALVFHQDPNLLTRKQIARRNRGAREYPDAPEFRPWVVLAYFIDEHAILAWEMTRGVEARYQLGETFETRAAARARLEEHANEHNLDQKATTLDLKSAAKTMSFLQVAREEPQAAPEVLAASFYNTSRSGVLW